MATHLSALIERIEAHPCGDEHELHGAILDALIGVDAADAKRWYGSGRLPTQSLDEALAFAERVAPGRSTALLRGVLCDDAHIAPRNLARTLTAALLRELGQRNPA